jgi:hypothetical protein
MKFQLILFICIIFNALADVQLAAAQVPFERVLKVKNNKETQINFINKKELEEVKGKAESFADYPKLANTFFYTIHQFVNENKKQCEFQFIEQLILNFKNAGFQDDLNSLTEYFKIIRINNDMDDLLLEIMIESSKDYFILSEMDNNKRFSLSLLKHKKLIENNDLSELYSPFQEFPDDQTRCIYQEFTYLRREVRNKKDQAPKKPFKILKTLNKKALDQEIIDEQTYNKLDYLTVKSSLKNRYVWLKDYLTIIFNAKDQLTPYTKTYTPINLEDENDFSSKIIHRRSQLTQRKLLYRKYDETQIILLAQVLQRASRRMGVDQDTISGIPVISQEFSVLQENGERETYVERIELDPQSQFNLARRLLRKDMVELQMMDTFNGLKITFEDIVMAAYETGYISIDDIEYVVKYDDLWNPTISKMQRVKGFIVRVTGYSTFFLPPPWNVIATIAIGVTDTVIDNRFFRNGADNDNPATFIE